MIVQLLGLNPYGFIGMMLAGIGLAFAGDDNGGGDDDKDKDKGGDDDKGKMVTMSQEALNNLIDDRARGLRVTIENEYKEKITTLDNTVKEMQKKLDAKPSDGDDDKGDGKLDQATIDAAVEKATGNLKTKIGELEIEITSAKDGAAIEVEKRKQETKRALVGNGLSNLKVLKPDEVFAVLEYNKAIGFDKDGNIVPITPDGNPVIGDGGNPQTLDKFLTEYIDARPHLVAPSGNAGSDADAGGGGGADDTKPKDDESFMRKALDEADVREAAGLQTHGKTPIKPD